MVNKHSQFSALILVIVTGFCLVPPSTSAGEPVCFLTERETEISEARAAMESLVREDTKLRAKLEQSEASLSATLKNLSMAMSEAEESKRAIGELKRRFEALGLDGGGISLERLQQRLLSVVGDLKTSRDECAESRRGFSQLREAVIAFKRASVTDEARVLELVESAIRSATKALGVEPEQTEALQSASATIHNGMVISIKEELALVIANLGNRQGVKVGMPFQVLREDNIVGTVRIVDTRERIAGAVIQNLSSEKERIQVGDRLKVIAVPK